MQYIFIINFNRFTGIKLEFEECFACNKPIKDLEYDKGLFIRDKWGYIQQAGSGSGVIPHR